MAAKQWTLTGGTGVTAVTPKFTFTAGTVTATVNSTLVHTFTSGEEATIALTVGQTLVYDFSDWDAVTRIDINGDKVSGSLSTADLGTGLEHLYCSGSTLLTGNMSLADAPAGMTGLYFSGCTLLTGDLSGGTSLAGMQYLYTNGTQCGYGTGDAFQYVDASLVKIDLDDCRLTWIEVNRVLADLVASGVSGKALDIAGTNSGPTATGAADAATLTSRSWTLSLNDTVTEVSQSRLHDGLRGMRQRYYFS